MQEKQIEKIIKQSILKFQNGNSPHEKEYAIKNGVSEIIRLTDSLTPPDAEKADLIEWISNNQFTFNGSVWTSTKIHYSGCAYTSKELLSLINKQGGK